MAINVITYNGKEYTDSEIEQATLYTESAYVGDTLPYSSMEIDLWDFSRDLLQYCTNDDIVLYQTTDGLWVFGKQSATDLTAYTYGAPVTWTHNGQLLAVMYLTSCARIGKYKFRLTCVSGVGLIAEARHYGGLYSNVQFGDLLSDIIGGAFQYQVDSNIASIPIYGWLPIDTRRGNLRRLLTSSGVVIRTNAQGLPWFTSPVTADPASIPDSSIEMGGSVDYPTPYQAVKITEHAFAALPTDLLKTLFDGESASEPLISPAGVAMNGTLVTFSEPMHDLTIENGTIMESGVNYAVLGQSPGCTLTGLVYSHTKRIITAGALTATEQATKRLDDNALVNLFNSENVAERWYQYYSSPRTVNISAVWNGSQAGDAVSFSDPYDDPIIGLVSSMDFRLSATIMTDMVVQAGNLPDIIGNFYTNLMLVTASGNVTIPATSNNKIRAVLIGGGDGGEAGEAGTAGESVSITGGTGGKGGDGGAPGNPGAGGKIYVVTIPVTPGQVIPAVIGIGGSGGSPGGSPTSGGATTFGDYSSANGIPSDTGISALIGTDVYGLPGVSGVAGGNGSGVDETGESVTFSGQTWTPGQNGQTEYDSGATAGGGYGGGAAVGSNGGSGEDGNVTHPVNGTYSNGGDGGSGADAQPGENGDTPGQGGGGGHGGGGGGGGGGAQGGAAGNAGGTGGAPGNPGAGGDGAAGIILIYY